MAAKRIVGGKWGPCSGQACIAIDYVLVEHKFASTLVKMDTICVSNYFLRFYNFTCTGFFQIELLKKTINKFYGENPKALKNLSKIVNKHQFDRLRNIIEDPAVAASIVHGGSLDETNL